MFQERLEDLSCYYWLVNSFSAYPFIKVVDGFPIDDLVVPSISVNAETINMVDFELGNKEGLRERLFSIDVFAVNKSQRDEFGYKILNELKDGIPVYNYNEGFPPDVSPTQLGKLLIKERKLEFLKIFPELVGQLYYRANILFIAYFDRV